MPKSPPKVRIPKIGCWPSLMYAFVSNGMAMLRNLMKILPFIWKFLMELHTQALYRNLQPHKNVTQMSVDCRHFICTTCNACTFLLTVRLIRCYSLKTQMRTHRRTANHFYHTPPFHPSVRTGFWSPTYRGTLVYLSQFRCKYKPPRSVTRPFLFIVQYYIRCLLAFSTVSRQIIPRKYLAGFNTTYPRTEGCFLLNICTSGY